jgi:3-phenylpropionate/trans-cinnamate dioxygenase ferredoxin reductase component
MAKGSGRKKIAIIGNGISGTTAARFIRKQSNHDIVVISKETDHFFSRTAIMYIYMGHMKYEHTKPYEDFFWSKNRIDLIRGEVENIDFEKKVIHFKDSAEFETEYPAPGTLNYDALILALGSKSQYYNWPGQDLEGVNGLYSFQDLGYMEKYTENIDRGVVVGGGLIGVEMAEMMATRKIPVSFLVREDHFFGNAIPEEEAKMIGQHISDHGIDLRLNTEIAEITAGENGRCNGVVTKDGERIPCQFVGLTTGVTPNISFLENSEIETQKGILVDEYLQTNIEDVYAIGDCAQLRNPPPGRNPIESVWYTGRIMGMTVAATLCGNRKKYNPGIWFNSAKFFDIEYQVYGHVPPEIPDELDSYYWQDDKKHSCLRVVFSKGNEKVLGIHGFGLRLRQEVCEKWIREGKTVDEVIADICAAVFEGEFTRSFEREILASYNRERNKSISLRKKRSWKSALSILSGK